MHVQVIRLVEVRTRVATAHFNRMDFPPNAAVGLNILGMPESRNNIILHLTNGDESESDFDSGASSEWSESDGEAE